MKKLIILLLMISSVAFAGEGADGGGPKAGIEGLARSMGSGSGEFGRINGERLSIDGFIELIESNNNAVQTGLDGLLSVDTNQVSDLTIDNQVYDVFEAQESYPELITVQESRTYLNIRSTKKVQDIQFVNGDIFNFKK